MTDTIDIQQKIKSDFGDHASEVMKLLDEAISKAEHLNHDRTIRCIIFLSDKDIEKLKKNIEAATADPRDVMLWAEYANHGQEKITRQIRDFNKTFDEADKDISD